MSFALWWGYLTIPFVQVVLDTEKLTSEELSIELRARGLSTAGTKAAKKERLERSLVGASDIRDMAALDEKQLARKKQLKSIPPPPQFLRWD
jgi:hypothetical protein